MSRRSKSVNSPRAASSPAVKWSLVLLAICCSAFFLLHTQRHQTAAARETASDETFLPTVENKIKPSEPAPEGMVWIPGGEFSMGADDSGESLCGLPGVTRDSQPIHRVYVDGFWMDATEVTNEQFDRFVKATGYRTIAEITPTKEEFPTAPPEN